jgi:hypothetical protein
LENPLAVVAWFSSAVRDNEYMSGGSGTVDVRVEVTDLDRGAVSTLRHKPMCGKLIPIYGGVYTGEGHCEEYFYLTWMTA